MIPLANTVAMTFFAVMGLILVVHVMHIEKKEQQVVMLRSLHHPINDGIVPVADTQFTVGSFHSQQTNEPPPVVVQQGTGPGDDTVFLFGIFSTLKKQKHAVRRQQIRDTYLSVDDDVRICSLQNYMIWKNEQQQQRAQACRVVYTFVIGANETESTDHYRSDRPLVIDQPHNHNNSNNNNKHSPTAVEEEDCTYLNIQENMNQGKTFTWWKYAAHISSVYGIDYVAKVDDDTLISINHFLDFIQSDLPPYPYNVRTYGGSMFYNPNRMMYGHLYAAGQFVFFSRDMALYISHDDIDRTTLLESELGFRQRPTAAEDIDSGTIAWTHPYPLKIIFMNQRVPWIHHVKDATDWTNLWEETGGSLPLSRVIGRIEYKIKPGQWTLFHSESEQ